MIRSIIAIILLCHTVNIKAVSRDTVKIKKQFNTILTNGSHIEFSKVKTRYQEILQKQIADTLFYKVTLTDIFGVFVDDEITLAKVRGKCLIENGPHSPNRLPNKYFQLYDVKARPGDHWPSANLFDSLEGTIQFERKVLDTYTNEYLYVFTYAGNFASHSDHVSRFYISETKGIVRIDYNKLEQGKVGERAICVSSDYVKRGRLKAYIKNNL